MLYKILYKTLMHKIFKDNETYLIILNIIVLNVYNFEYQIQTQ